MARPEERERLRIQTRHGWIEVSLRRRSMKHMRLVVDRDGEIAVSAPPGATSQDVARFVRSNEEWLRKSVQKCLDRKAEPGTIMLEGRVLDLRFVPDTDERVEVTDGALLVHGPLERGAQILETWWRSRLEAVCQALVDKWYPVVEAHGAARRPKVSIRKMKSRWGSCTPSNATVRISYYLLSATPEGMDYVVLHELAHLLYPDHGSLFKQFLTKFMPDWKERRRGLDDTSRYIGAY